MRTKLLLFMAVCVVAVALVAVAFYYARKPTSNALAINQEFIVPAELASSAPFDSSRLVYSNGQGLALYNYRTDEIAGLDSSATGLQSIDTVSMSPDGNFVLFHDEEVAPGGTFAAQLSSLGYDPTLDYWWVYNVQARTYTPLPQGAVLAKIDDQYAYTLTADSTNVGKEKITLYSLPQLQAVSSVVVPGSSNFFPTGSGYLLQDPNNEILSTTDGVVVNTILQSATLVGVVTGQNYALAVATENGTQDLVKLNLTNNSTSVITTNVVNTPAWLSSGVALFSTSPNATTAPQLYTYSLVTGKITPWTLASGIKGFGNTGAQLLTLLGNNAAIVSGSGGTNYLLGTDLAAPSALQ